MNRPSRDDSGSAVVEFVVVVVLIMAPLAYAVVVLTQLHTASSAVIVAAREAARSYVTADTPTQGGIRANQAAELAINDQGLDNHRVVVRCLDGPCLSPGSRVRVEVVTNVRIPFMPFADAHGVIPVQSSHDATVDTYRES